MNTKIKKNTVMKTLLLQSNHGNHSGFNRTWSIIEKFNNIEEAKKKCAELHNELYEVFQSDDININYDATFESSLDSFEYDLYYYKIISQDDYNNGIFNGGHYGYASKDIINYFENN